MQKRIVIIMIQQIELGDCDISQPKQISIYKLTNHLSNGQIAIYIESNQNDILSMSSNFQISLNNQMVMITSIG